MIKVHNSKQAYVNAASAFMGKTERHFNYAKNAINFSQSLKMKYFFDKH